MPECEHDIVFVGMVNVNRDNYLQGVVDVWRCRKCKKIFCDDRRYGEPLKPSVGFEELPDDEEWAILTCSTEKSVQMISLGVKPGKRIEHICSDEKREFIVKQDLTIEGNNRPPIHRLWLVRDHINKNIEAGVYRLKAK